jgi:ATP-dependent Clp protease ATP-binding subunit ClpA
MFERYTETARRTIFFGRYEASQFGSPYIETEHLLLGLLREDKALANRFLRSHAAVESIRKQILSAVVDWVEGRRTRFDNGDGKSGSRPQPSAVRLAEVRAGAELYPEMFGKIEKRFNDDQS